MKKRISLFLVLVLVMVSMSSCYYNKKVGSNEVGIQMDDGVSITAVVGAGRYTKMKYYADLICIDTSSKSLVWQDDDVWTSDKQSVTFGVSITYARKNDADSVKLMWSEYNAAAKKDKDLESLVLSRIPRVVKQVSTTYTLDEMLGIADSEKNRATMQAEMETLLAAELNSCGVMLIDFGVSDIGVDPVYQEKLQEKSTAAIEIELAQQRKEQLETQLEQERAQTEIDLEKARRANLVAEEEAKVYKTSDEAFELKRLELMKDMLDETDKVYFIPEGSDITLFFGTDSPMVTPN
jgi:hypothetical protein